MYVIDKDKELTPELIGKYINNFVFTRQPKIQKWQNQYNGKHSILNKVYTDASKPCNRIVTNFCSVIANTYAGYIVGKPVSYGSDTDIEAVQDVLNYNDCATEDSEWLKNALVCGVGYEVHYIDEEGKSRFSTIEPSCAFAIYSNDLNRNMMYFVRWYPLNEIDNEDKYICEVYDNSTIKKYEMQNQLGSLLLLEETPHYFKQVPVSVLLNNAEETSIFDNAISLNDAYNELQSAELDDYQAFVDAYLVLSEMDADAEDIAKMKENRVLIIPGTGSATYLTKQVNDAQILNMLSTLQKNIFKVTSCPDMSDENFLAQSGTALAYKLTGFENMASNIVANMTKAIQKRIELICEILNLKGSESMWRDIQINFKRNLPNNTTELIQLINSCQGIVSDKTLLGQIPFVKDVDAELEAVQKQKQENMEMYSFGDGSKAEDEDDEA